MSRKKQFCSLAVYAEVSVRMEVMRMCSNFANSRELPSSIGNEPLNSRIPLALRW